MGCLGSMCHTRVPAAPQPTRSDVPGCPPPLAGRPRGAGLCGPARGGGCCDPPALSFAAACGAPSTPWRSTSSSSCCWPATRAPSSPIPSNEDWTVCNRCETYRPPRAHHCRVCHRCVRRMDHHCPWINNCVGELNQKYFIQFLFYTGLASLYAVGLVLAAWLWPTGRSPAGTVTGARGDVSNNRVQTAHCIVLLVESVVFGAFVTVIFYDQVMSIITDETPLEQLRNRVLKEAKREVAHTRKPKLALLREVFGRGFVICWFFPWNCSAPAGTGPAYSYLPNYDV
uniref:Palmitoyltransferase n=1 Tax=Apteryx owenii TaxID=8824 RepID=A0A8B9S461_APTOW